jgi:hypothetical protein
MLTLADRLRKEGRQEGKQEARQDITRGIIKNGAKLMGNPIDLSNRTRYAII